MLIMWKPVRLQGVGAASSIINANTHPAGKMDIWREKVVCLFGLSLNGSPTTAANPFDPTGAATCGSTIGTAWRSFTPTANNPQVDRLPLEAVVGWDANLNGNLAEQLQEPSLMGALEGAGITVLAKGVNFPSNPYDPTLLAGFPTGTTLLIGSEPAGNFPVGDANPNCHTSTTIATNPFPSDYSCNPSSIEAWASPTVPRVAAPSSSMAGGITCKSPTTGSSATLERFRAASTSVRASIPRLTSRGAPQTPLLAPARTALYRMPCCHTAKT